MDKKYSKQEIEELLKRDASTLTVEEKRIINLRQYGELKKQTMKDNVIPKEIESFVYSHICGLLDQAEFKIYTEEIKSWVLDHPDWNAKEDIDDINGIAWEKVVQFRLLVEKRAKKTLDIDKEFTNSKAREMVHRGNLGAKRSTRVIEGKQTGNNTMNIVVLGTKIDENGLKKVTGANEVESLEEDNLFPCRAVIDAEIVKE